MRGITRFLTLCLVTLVLGCGANEPASYVCEGECPQLLMELTPGDLGLATPPMGFSPVRVGFFLSVSEDTPAVPWTRQEAAQYIRTIIESTNTIVAACSLYVEVEVAIVITLPASLLDIQGNDPGSFGGHPPPGTTNVELFNYEQNETLTAEIRTLFGFAKTFASANAISAITVQRIEYYAEGETVSRGAGGLSFPPNNYHREEDYPLRNSVLLVPAYGDPGALPGPLAPITLAHELGHMVINVGDHNPDPQNLMSGMGTDLTTDQCNTMRANLDRLFGSQAIADPGPPN